MGSLSVGQLCGRLCREFLVVALNSGLPVDSFCARLPVGIAFCLLLGMKVVKQCTKLQLRMAVLGNTECVLEMALCKGSLVFFKH